MDLYALPPEEFTAARDAQGPAFKKLRRPTMSAWVVNTLVRREPALLEQLLALGADLAAAQSGRDAAALRTLGDQRRQLVAAVADRAVELVDRTISPAVKDEVIATLEAALADPASAEAVLSGGLVRSLSFAGFGGVDLDGAVAALPKAAPVKAPAKVGKLERAAQEAAGALDDAVRHAQRIEREATAAQQASAAAQEALTEATARAAELRAALSAAESTEKAAASRAVKAAKETAELDRNVARAVAAVATAQEAADRARLALDTTRRS